MTSPFDQFEFISDPRDGKNFDVIKNLEAAALRGSEHAKGFLNRLDYQAANPDFGIPHSKIVSDLKVFEDRWEVIRAFEEDDEGDVDEIEDQDDLFTEIIEWIEHVGLEGARVESYEYIFDKYINFQGYGCFGQGSGNLYDEDLKLLVINPQIPRDLLWEISVGDSARRVSDPNWDGSCFNEWPRYVNDLSISPIASTNLLKAIIDTYFVNSPFHLHTMLNANSDISLLKDLDPESVRDNLIIEIDSTANGHSTCFDEDFEEKFEWLLRPYFATKLGIIEFNEAEGVLHNKFSNPSGCGALLIATRMSEEFKVGNVEVADHLNSDSEILRTLLYYNPDLPKDQKESLLKLGIIELDNDVAELYKSAWKQDNPTMVM